MKNQVLEIRNLRKSYGSLLALDDFSLQVNKGEVFGILGPNGSGKTTTLGILLDIIKPDSGQYAWFGARPFSNQRARIGALLEQPLFYPYLSAVKNLEIIADIKNVAYGEIDELLEKVGLTGRKHSKFKTYSLGMKQRLAIAASLIGKPEVLILDEPTNGLDPRSIAEIRELIIDIASRGITVLLASHLLDEVQKICSHVAILDRGKLLHTGRVDEVLNSSPMLELQADDMRALHLALQHSGVVDEIVSEGPIWLVRMNKETGPAEVNKMLTQQGIYLTHLAQRHKSLEKHFLELVAENHA
ncbi:MAG: ATP-binding cassette domain-containing protein [Bacteroidales bacterium]|nr:ATP-binding cassette domain-containing protein [Bacteroidales bacterium]MCF6342303.1 ATP-binding cassette domain-containing protein [Bacteroidales bacterium]